MMQEITIQVHRIGIRFEIGRHCVMIVHVRVVLWIGHYGAGRGQRGARGGRQRRV